MPGSNCSIFGCTVSRRTPGLAIFGIPRGNDEYSSTWRAKLVNIITRDRHVDQDLRLQIEKRNLHICQRHYSEELLIPRKYFLGLINMYHVGFSALK